MPADLKQVLEVLQRHVGAEPDHSHLVAALTRKAWNLEAGQSDAPDHESLEWLGDRILGAVVAQELWRRFPHAEPGKLDILRNELTSEPPLAEVAAELNLVAIIRMGVGERQQGQAQNARALSSHLEALLGAVFLTGGWSASVEVINLLLRDRYPEILPDEGHRGVAIDGSNAMTALYERVQKLWRKNLDSGAWAVEQFGGADKAPIHHQATVTLPDGTRWTGEMVHGTKSEAKASAARVALGHLSG